MQLMQLFTVILVVSCRILDSRHDRLRKWQLELCGLLRRLRQPFLMTLLDTVYLCERHGLKLKNGNCGQVLGAHDPSCSLETPKFPPLKHYARWHGGAACHQS